MTEPVTRLSNVLNSAETWASLADSISDRPSREIADTLDLLTRGLRHLLRKQPPPALTPDERKIHDEELLDHPLFDDVIDKNQLIMEYDAVLEQTERGHAVLDAWRRDPDRADFEEMDSAVTECWDFIVEEYTYHELSHMVALSIAQVLHEDPSRHESTWLIKMSSLERVEKFLKLAESLDLCSPSELAQALQKIG